MTDLEAFRVLVACASIGAALAFGACAGKALFEVCSEFGDLAGAWLCKLMSRKRDQ